MTPHFIRAFFDAANRVFPMIGENRGIAFTDTIVARVKVNAGSYVLVFLSNQAHGGCAKGGEPPTTADPLYHVGMHDGTVQAGCSQMAFIAPAGESGYLWVVETPSLVESIQP